MLNKSLLNIGAMVPLILQAVLVHLEEMLFATLLVCYCQRKYHETMV